VSCVLRADSSPQTSRNMEPLMGLAELARRILQTSGSYGPTVSRRTTAAAGGGAAGSARPNLSHTNGYPPRTSWKLVLH